MLLTLRTNCGTTLLLGASIALIALCCPVLDDNGRELSHLSPRRKSTSAQGVTGRPRSTTGQAIKGLPKDLPEDVAVMIGPPEELPSKLRAHIVAIIPSHRTDIELGRSQYVPFGKVGVWIVGGQRVMCVAQSGQGAIGCEPSAEFSEHGIAVGSFEPPTHAGGSPREFRIAGVMPDWVESIRVQVGDDPVRSVTVRSNAFMVESDKSIRVMGLTSR